MLGIMGLLPVAAKVVSGEAQFAGDDLLAIGPRQLRKLRGGRIGFIFQDPMTSFNPVLTIGEQIIEPLRYHLKLGRKAARQRAAELMRLVGIPGGEKRLDDYPHQFSGGMRQRIMIAIALACEPELLIADEPTTALDVTIQAQIVELVSDLRARMGMAVIWITHDLALVSGMVDRIIVLYAGNVVEVSPVADLYAAPSHPYTQGLLGSLPRIEGELQRRLPSIGGSPPDVNARPAGCAFAARCPHRIDRCAVEAPPLEAAGAVPGHLAACWVKPRSVA
jgi:peptide/nickel transport system ATP-binding protein